MKNADTNTTNTTNVQKLIRRSSERGHANHGWLDSYHSFSFADYYDPQFMGFQDLRVINEDRIAGGAGFPTHGHKDMEIVTCVFEGSLEHKDSMGNSEVIRPYEVQRMTAGTGVRHSEFNHSPTEACHLYQIWILPAEKNLTPGYEQKSFQEVLEKKNLALVASPEGEDGSVKIHQQARVYLSRLKGDKDRARLEQKKDFPYYWIQCVKGEVQTLGETLKAGDAMAVRYDKTASSAALEIQNQGSLSELIIFELI